MRKLWEDAALTRAEQRSGNSMLFELAKASESDALGLVKFEKSGAMARGGRNLRARGWGCDGSHGMAMEMEFKRGDAQGLHQQIHFLSQRRRARARFKAAHAIQAGSNSSGPSDFSDAELSSLSAPPS